MAKQLIFSILILMIFGNIKAQDTVTTASGLKYIILEAGNGNRAENEKSVEVHYTGYLIDGKIFDSSYDRNEPIEFVLGTGKVIKGWDEGIALMSVGDKYRLIIPPDLAYGSNGAGNVIPPNATLIFDTELISAGDPRASITSILLQTILESDVETAIKQYNEMKSNSPDSYNFKEGQLNDLGYQLLKLEKFREAIEILKLNAEVFPNSANVYDSIGEACMMNGDTKLAIENYKKSLELDSSNKNAMEKLRQLEK